MFSWPITVKWWHRINTFIYSRENPWSTTVVSSPEISRQVATRPSTFDLYIIANMQQQQNSISVSVVYSSVQYTQFVCVVPTQIKDRSTHPLKEWAPNEQIDCEYRFAIPCMTRLWLVDAIANCQCWLNNNDFNISFFLSKMRSLSCQQC